MHAMCKNVVLNGVCLHLSPSFEASPSAELRDYALGTWHRECGIVDNRHPTGRAT